MALPKTKAIRKRLREGAEERAKARKERSVGDQLKLVATRRGESKRERARLEALTDSVLSEII